METNRIEKVLEDIKQHYKSWSEFMEQEVDFWKVEKDWHTKPHCARVLFYYIRFSKTRMRWTSSD